MQNISSRIGLFAKGLSNNGVGVGTGTVLQELRPGCLKPAIPLKKSWGGYRRTTLDLARAQ